MVVNLMIIAQMNKYHLIGMILPLLSILVYFLIYFLMNLKFYNSDVLYGTFIPEMSAPLTYLGLFLVGGTLFSTEKIRSFIDLIEKKGQQTLPRSKSIAGNRPVSTKPEVLEPLLPRNNTVKRLSVDSARGNHPDRGESRYQENINYTMSGLGTRMDSAFEQRDMVDHNQIL